MVHGIGGGRRAALVALALLLAAAAGCSRQDPRWRSGPVKPSVENEPREITQLRAAAKKDPMSGEAHVRLAGAYLKHNRLKEATDAFRRALECDPANTEALLGLSLVAAQMEDGAAALGLAEFAVKQKPKDPAALNALGTLLMRAGRMDQAAECFDRALKARPNEPLILMNAAVCQARRKRWREAEAYCGRAAKATPQDPTPRLLLGDLHLRQGAAARAEAVWRDLAREHPRNPVVYERLGRARAKQGRLKEALRDFAEAQRLAPRWTDPYIGAGAACLKLQDFARAEKHFRRAAKIAPEALTPRLGIAEAAFAQGKRDEAIAINEGILGDFPGDQVVQNNLAYLYAEKGVRLDRAQEIAERIAKANPENASMKDTLGWVHYRRGRHAEAVKHLQEAARLAPERGTFQYHLGKALLASGRAGEAAGALRAALSLELSADQRKDAQTALAAAGGR